MCFIIIISLILAHFSFVTNKKHPDENLNITQMIRRHNYRVEEHNIESSDGYLLKTFRIPHGKAENFQVKGIVLIAHGLACSADDWITLGNDSLPYFMADNGYDVWLFNARGTKHSKKHRLWDSDKDSEKFWNFSWDEIGIYDLSANINYILNVTNAENLFYIGHSQGGTALYVMLSLKPEMNAKLTMVSLFAPAAYFTNIKDAILLRFMTVLYSPYARNANFEEFPPKSLTSSHNLSKELCSLPFLNSLCHSAIYFGNMENHPIDKNLVPIIVQHAPTSLSTKQIHHYSQIMQTGEFKRYDYGKKLNLKKYGTKKPPLYNISRIQVPMMIFYGTGDFLASPMSVKKIANELTNNPQLIEVPYKDFDHIDFLWARNAKTLIYEKTYEEFEKYI